MAHFGKQQLVLFVSAILSKDFFIRSQFELTDHLGRDDLGNRPFRESAQEKEAHHQGYLGKSRGLGLHVRKKVTLGWNTVNICKYASLSMPDSGRWS